MNCATETDDYGSGDTSLVGDITRNTSLHETGSNTDDLATAGPAGFGQTFSQNASEHLNQYDDGSSYTWADTDSATDTYSTRTISDSSSTTTDSGQADAAVTYTQSGAETSGVHSTVYTFDVAAGSK